MSRRRRRARSFWRGGPLQGGVSGDGVAEDEEGEGGAVGGAEEERKEEGERRYLAGGGRTRTGRRTGSNLSKLWPLSDFDH